VFGLGDVQPSLFLSPAQPGKLIWGMGPVLQFPTATDDSLGQGKWGAGPTAVALVMHGPWVSGVSDREGLIRAVEADSDCTRRPAAHTGWGSSGNSLGEVTPGDRRDPIHGEGLPPR
jgi:hypothetical protein